LFKSALFGIITHQGLLALTEVPTFVSDSVALVQ